MGGNETGCYSCLKLCTKLSDQILLFEKVHCLLIPPSTETLTLYGFFDVKRRNVFKDKF